MESLRKRKTEKAFTPLGCTKKEMAASKAGHARPFLSEGTASNQGTAGGQKTTSQAQQSRRGSGVPAANFRGV